jgi:hypothetical protein
VNARKAEHIEERITVPQLKSIMSFGHGTLNLAATRQIKVQAGAHSISGARPLQAKVHGVTHNHSRTNRLAFVKEHY